MAVWKKTASVLVALCAAFSFLCFADLWVNSILTPTLRTWIPLLGWIPPAVILAVPLVLFFLRKRETGKGTRIVRWIYTALVVLFTVTFACFTAYLASFSAAVPENRGETVILVYGCSTRNDKPGAMLTERLEGAAKLLSENPEAVCIVSGGIDAGAVSSEGEIMKRYLVGKGIAEERIVAESKALSTLDNVRLMKQILDERGWTGWPCISVSSSFHIPRISVLCAQNGLSSSYYGVPTASPVSLFSSVVREYFSTLLVLIRFL